MLDMKETTIIIALIEKIDKLEREGIEKDEEIKRLRYIAHSRGIMLSNNKLEYTANQFEGDVF